MRTMKEWVSEIEEILKEVDSGTMDLEKASVLIDGVETIVETYNVQLEYNKIKAKDPNFRIDFMEDDSLDDLPSSEDIRTVKEAISTAKEEIEKRQGD